MSIRMVRYSLLTALEYAEKSESGDIVVQIPDMCTLYVRRHMSLPESCSVTYRASDGRAIVLHTPNIQAGNYDIDDIIERNLLILAPYYILRHESFLKSKRKDDDRIRKICTEMDTLCSRIAALSDKDGKSILYYNILGLIQEITGYITVGRSEEEQEEIRKTIGGIAMKLWSEKAMEQLDEERGGELKKMREELEEKDKALASAKKEIAKLTALMQKNVATL